MCAAALGAAAVAVLLAASPAAAQFVCTTTPTDRTCINAGTAGGFFTNPAGGANQNATTSNSGTANGFESQTAAGGNATAINTGSSAGNIMSEALLGGNATTTNSGSNAANITTEALRGGNATTTNTGSNAGGIETLTNDGGNATTTNTGSNAGIDTVTLNGGNATTTNTGSNAGIIDTVTLNGGNATTINSGSNAGGITTQTINGGNATVVNTGTSVGLVLLQTGGGGTATLTNSGTIANPGGVAIQFIGGPDTLNVLPGSFILGGISLVGVSDTVNISAVNQNLTFNTLAGATVTGTVPFVVAGNQLVTVDPTPFALADKNLMDFTRGISGILDSLGGSSSAGPMMTAFAPTGSILASFDEAFAGVPALAYANDSAMVFKAPTMVASDGRAVWARGFGGARTQDPQDGLLGAHTSFYGGAVGFDMVARGDLRLGLFAGGGESRLSLDGNNGFTNTDTAFGGLYGRWSFASLGHASFLDFALHGGGSTNNTSRTVNNNLAPTGIELATATYNSSYVSPQLKYGVNLPLWAQYTLTPSIGVRYVAGFFGGYTEVGTTAPLTVASRTTQDIEERGELKLTRAQPLGPDLLLTSVHLGALGLERFGDTTVNTVVLGASLPFVTPGKSDVAGLVGGGGFEWRTREGVSLFGSAEAIGFTDQSTVWDARGGMRVAF